MVLPTDSHGNLIQPAPPPDNRANFTTELLNIDKDYTVEFKKLLLGKIKKEKTQEVTNDDGSKTIVIIGYEWVDSKSKKPLINQQGYSEIMTFIDPYVNPLVPRSSLKRETIFQICRELEYNLILKMVSSFDKWNVDPDNIGALISGVTYLVLISLSRAEEGRTIEGITRGSSRQEIIHRDDTKKGIIPANIFKR